MMTKAPPASCTDNSRPEAPPADTAADNANGKAHEPLSNTKTVGQADQDYRLPGPQPQATAAKANSVPTAVNRASGVPEASEDDAALQTKADEVTTRPDVARAQAKTVSPESPNTTAPDADTGEERLSATPGGTSVIVRAHQNGTDGARENLGPLGEASRDMTEGQSSEVKGHDEPQVSREVKSASTQTEEAVESPERVTSDGHQRVAVLDAGTQTDEAGRAEEEEGEDDEITDSPCPSPVSAAGSDTLLLTSSFPIPANPAHLAERIRRNRSRMSAAYDDTEYEPYGLPEVVMKGEHPSAPLG